jgi:hypothetical protein
MREQTKIKDRAAAAVFASPLQSKIVQTLIPHAMTMAALARLIELPLSLLHYHVAKCVALGLLKVERVEPRAGRPVKHYRATARTFFVPTELLPKMPGTDMSSQLRAALDSNQARSVEGVNFAHDGLRPSVFLVKARASQATAIELWLDIGLTSAHAIELIEEMKSVMERYRVRDNPRAPRYLLHMAVAKA